MKIARKYGEECKVAIRKARHDALDMLSQLETEGESSADEVDRGKKKVEETVPRRRQAGRLDHRAQRKGHSRGVSG